MGMEDHAESIVNAALRALPEFVGMPHQTITVGEQISDSTLELLRYQDVGHWIRRSCKDDRGPNPCQVKEQRHGGDGNEEETPNKRLRSHSSSTPLQSPEQNVSFAEMFANIGATPSEASTVDVGMVYIAVEEAMPTAMDTSPARSGTVVFPMDTPVPRTFSNSPVMVNDEGCIPREVWEDADKMRREVRKLTQVVDELRAVTARHD